MATICDTDSWEVIQQKLGKNPSAYKPYTNHPSINGRWDIYFDKKNRWIQWDCKWLAYYIPLEYIDKQKWSMFHLSQNKNINSEFLFKHIHMKWNYTFLSENPNVIDFILAYPELDWYYPLVSRNIGLYPEALLKLIQLGKPIEWKFVSGNIGITEEFIEAHPELPWNWEYISSRQYMSLDFLRRNLDKPLDWIAISHWLNVSIDDVDANSDLPWDTDMLEFNDFYNRTKEERFTRLKEQIKMIKEDLIAAVWHPERMERIANMFHLEIDDYMDMLD